MATREERGGDIDAAAWANATLGFKLSGAGEARVQEKRAARAQAPTQFNLFMKKAVAEVKLEEPAMDPKEIFAKCAAMWKLSPENPKMGRVQFHLSSVSGLVSNIWCRIPLDRTELSISKLPPTHSPEVRPGRDP